MKKERNVGLDLLKNVSMFMIVLIHYLMYGKFLDIQYNENYEFIMGVIRLFCIVAVNCYVLISGYFLVKSEFKIKKLIKLYGQVIFYSISIYIILI